MLCQLRKHIKSDQPVVLTDCTSALSGFVIVIVRHSCTTLIFSLMAAED